MAVFNLEIRSYRTHSDQHEHDFSQVVLPISGHMDIDVQGRGGRIDSAACAIVAPGAPHAQAAQSGSRFLVLDCPHSLFQSIALERLAQQIYVPISPAARRLIEFAELAGNRQLAENAAHLVPLLLSALASTPLPVPCGIERLIARLHAQPAGNWSNDAMAQVAGVSASQLHQRFRTLYQTTPQAWLADLRIRQAQRWLADSTLPIADIAQRAGYSDQAALTRAMGRVCGTTPSAFRKSRKQPG
ncbi:MAG: AraC family transcriptional regulator [Pseudomonas sp.]|uniref:helix-turn-helix transcriptional regulator n=1 Tax=Pseudomonas abieticivorans TaxID=2931382 RepID=UPI0020BE7B9A|nr:AraC family transcriptional regulator [Pseudomonas sp. PIA16]MDE1165305.1 AraC family transcriptional regulator [Pseudomonas sp.]